MLYLIVRLAILVTVWSALVYDENDVNIIEMNQFKSCDSQCIQRKLRGRVTRAVAYDVLECHQVSYHYSRGWPIHVIR